VILLNQLEFRGGGRVWKEEGRYVVSKIHKTSCFILFESLDVPPEHTHTHTHTRTHTQIYILLAALILPKYSVHKIYLSFFNHALPKIQSHASIAWPQGRSWLFSPFNAELNPICHLLALLGAHHIFHVNRLRVKTRQATTVSFSVCQPIPNLSHDPHTLPLQAAHLQQWLLSGRPKEGNRRLTKTDVDLPMRTF
jgi:hypothetical protein